MKAVHRYPLRMPNTLKKMGICAKNTWGGVAFLA